MIFIMWLLKWNTENNGPQLDFLQFLQFSLKNSQKTVKVGVNFYFYFQNVWRKTKLSGTSFFWNFEIKVY